jgi:hypothetical protein
MKRTREQVSKWAVEAIELVNSRNYPVYVTDTLVVGRNADGWWVSNGRQVGGLTVNQAIEKIVSSLA